MHPVVDLKQKLETFNKELVKYTTQLEKSVLADYTRALQTVKHDLAWYEEASQNTRRDLERDFKEVRTKMDDLQSQYLKYADNRMDSDINKLRERKRDLESKVANVSNLVKRCKAKFSSTSANDLQFEKECPNLKSFVVCPYTKPAPPAELVIPNLDTMALQSKAKLVSVITCFSPHCCPRGLRSVNIL